jgi:hypothetical protein
VTSTTAAIWGDVWESHWEIIYHGIFIPPVIGWAPDDVPFVDALSLIALYNATDGDNWGDNTNWITGTTVGDWYGVDLYGGRVDELLLNSNSLNGSLDNWSAPPAARLIRFNTNNGLEGDISTWVWPSAVLYVWLYSTSVSGDISGISWPASLKELLLYSTDVSGDLSGFVVNRDLQKMILHHTDVTGSIAGWTFNSELKTLDLGQTDMTGAMPALPLSTTILDVANTTVSVDLSTFNFHGAFIRLFATGCTVTGSPDFSSAALLQYFHVDDCGLSQAAVDAIVSDIYSNRAVFTQSTGPFLEIGGTNSAPSGVYQYAATPTTGKEMIYALVNDDDAEGFQKWTITYTA